MGLNSLCGLFEVVICELGFNNLNKNKKKDLFKIKKKIYYLKKLLLCFKHRKKEQKQNYNSF